MCFAVFAAAEESPVHDIAPTAGEITIDAVLDEEAWKDALILELAYETDPGENIPAQWRTEVLLTHDVRRLYIAFRAYDPEPSTIRAHLSDRDKAWGDDWVGVVLDTFNSERRAFEFLVNPLGVQTDMILDEVNGTEDPAWDAIWRSAGRITEWGYVVELSIPFSQLRFPRSTEGQTWGFDAVRFRPRDRSYVTRILPRDRNIDCELCQISKIHGFADVRPGRNLEIDPTVVAIRREEREDDVEDPLEVVEESVEPGVTAIWGFRPNLVLSAAINPDFSQVEADAAQLDVNERFALFFPEQRPFFLEGADYFDTPIEAVYTRTVADPNWGLKVTGKEGRNTFGVYAVEDDVTNLLFPGSESSDLESYDTPHNAGVFRYRRDVGATSALGALITGRSGDDYSNLLYGFDGQLRLSNVDTIHFQILQSETEYPQEVQEDFDQPEGSFTGHAIQAFYGHDARNWNWRVGYRDMSDGFRADSGFIPQVGFRRLSTGLERIWWSDQDWYSRMELGGGTEYATDSDGNMLEQEVELWWNFQGPMRSFFFCMLDYGAESYDGVRFDDLLGTRFFGRFWPSGDLQLGLRGYVGDAVDYANVQPGDQIRVAPYLFWRPGIHWQVQFEHEWNRLDVEGGRLFAANLTQGRLVYQFNIRTFVRAIIQYTDISRNPELYEDDDVDSRDRTIFGELLFAYKVNPQTVFYLGYSDKGRSDQDVDLWRASRSLFVKIGYAWLL